MSTNFQNLFQAGSNFQSDLDALLEHDENAQLVAGQAGAGAYGFGQPYTIGFGFDVSKQSGQAIISDFNAAGISLIINGKNVTSDLQNYNTSGTGKTSLATVNTDFQGLTINLEQALDLLNDVIPQYENGSTTLGLPGLIPTINGIGNTSPSALANESLAAGNSTLNELLMAEYYNVPGVFGGGQQGDLGSDNLDAFLEDELYNNNTINNKQTYDSGVEKRRMYDLAQTLGLTLAAPTGANPDYSTWSAIVFGGQTTAAAYIFSSLVSQASTISSRIIALSALPADNDSASVLTVFTSNTVNNAETTLQAASLYGVQQADVNAAANGGEDIWQYLAQKFGFTSAAALQAINVKFLSNAGNVVTFSTGQPDTGIGAGAVIHTLSSEVTGFPAISTIQTLDQKHTMLYDLDTGRTYTTGADVDGSDGGTFEIVDENGDTLASVQANTLTSAPTIVPIVAGAFIGAVQYTTTTGGTQTTAAPNYYDVQPGDGSLTSIATTLGLDPDLFASVNPGLDPNATLSVGTDLSLYDITNGPDGSQVDGLNNGIVNNYTGQNGTGNLTGSQVTTPDGQGNSVTKFYPGIGGTGTGNAPAVVTLADGYGDSITMGIGATNINLGATRTDAGNSTPYYDDSLTYIAGEGSGSSGSFTLQSYTAGVFSLEDSEGGYTFGESSPIYVDAMYPQSNFDVAESASTAGRFSATITAALTAGFTAEVNGQQVNTTPTTNVTFTVSGDVYAPAIAQVSENGTVLSGNPINFYGHVGDHISQAFTVANIATGALTDVLNTSLLPGYESIFAINPAQNIAAGSSGTMTVTLNTSQAGGFDGAAAINFLSHDSEQGDEGLAVTPQSDMNLIADINAYAKANVQLLNTTADLFGSGQNYTVNIGNVAQGSSAPVVDLGILNLPLNYSSSQYTDVLGGSFSVGGANSASFTNNGMGAFSGLYAQQEDGAPTIALSTTTLGSYTETLTVALTDSNSYGYSGSLPTITIKIYGTVVSPSGGTTNKPVTLAGGTTSNTGTNGDNNIANFTSGNATPNGQWAISENTAGTVVMAGAAAGYNGTATLAGFQQVDLNGTTYNLDDTTVSGEAMTVSAGQVAIAVDGPGSNTITFDNNQTTYWHAATGTTTAILETGTTELYMSGAESQYTIAWSGASTLTVTDKVANRNATKTIDLAGGNGDIVFADGSIIGLDQTTTGDSTVYAGTETQNIYGVAGETIYTGAGTDTVETTGSETVIGGSGQTTVYLAATDYTPDNLWAASENAAGQAVINGTNAGYSGTVTLSNISSLMLGPYATYSLITTPTTGGTTDITASSALVVDGAGNDTLVFNGDGDSYWHAGGGNDSATLYNGVTEIYMAGAESQYTIAFNGTNTLIVTDTVANRNGTKTFNMDGGQGEIVFADGSKIDLDQAGDTTVYGGQDNASLTGVANETIYAGSGGDTIYAAAGDTIIGNAATTVYLDTTPSYIPDQTFAFSENSSGQIVFNGSNAGFAGTVTMSNVGQIEIGPYYSPYSILATPVSGGSTTITTQQIVVDGPGNDTIDFQGGGAYWYAGAGNDTAVLQYGVTDIYMDGPESQYTVTFNGTDTVIVTDSVASRNGTKTIDLFGGDGDLVFASGGSIALGESSSSTGDTLGYGGFGSNVFAAAQSTDSFTGSPESITNIVQFDEGSAIPNAAWSISENAQGAVIMNGTAAGFNGSATLTDIQTVQLNGGTYQLVAAPVAGGAFTVSTPEGDGAQGVIVAEDTGHNVITIDNYDTTYWHVNGAGDSTSLQAGTTEIYMRGTESQYTFSSTGSTLDVADTVANRNGTLAVTTDGGLGQIAFSDGKLVWLGTETFVVSGGTTTSTGVGSSTNVVNFSKGDATPDGTWVVSETSGGAVTIAGGTGSAYSGTATLNDIQQVAMGAALYDLATAPVGGGSLTISTPTDLSSGTLVVDSTGNDTLAFSSNDITYWHASAGNDSAAISAGTNYVYFLGSSAQYTFAYSGSQVVVTDSQSARNGVKTINLSGGTTTLVFIDTSIALSNTGATETGAAGNDTFTLASSASAIINGGGGTNTVVFSSSTVLPTGAWNITENASSQVIVSGTSVGYTGTATLTSIQQLRIDGNTYALVETPIAGGSTTIATPGTGVAGTIVIDGAGADALTFSGTGTSYWHVGAGNNTATLSAGTTEIYFTGASSQYTETFSGTNVLTVTNTATSATETLTLSGGSGELVFASGSNIALNKSGDTTIYGGSTAATLTGTTGADTIYAGSGADTLIGDGGADIYKIGAGTTTETIQNGVSSSNTAAGNLDFTGSIDAANLWFIHSGNNLVVDVLGTTRQTVLQNWFATGDTYAQTSEIVSADALKLDTSLNNLITAMATFSASNSGFNPQTTTDTTLTNSTFYGTLSATDKSSWHS